MLLPSASRLLPSLGSRDVPVPVGEYEHQPAQYVPQVSDRYLKAMSKPKLGINSDRLNVMSHQQQQKSIVDYNARIKSVISRANSSLIPPYNLYSNHMRPSMNQAYPPNPDL